MYVFQNNLPFIKINKLDKPSELEEFLNKWFGDYNKKKIDNDNWRVELYNSWYFESDSKVVLTSYDKPVITTVDPTLLDQLKKDITISEYTSVINQIQLILDDVVKTYYDKFVTDVKYKLLFVFNPELDINDNIVTSFTTSFLEITFCKVLEPLFTIKGDKKVNKLCFWKKNNYIEVNYSYDSRVCLKNRGCLKN
jgi:hypothetical protein